MIVVLKHNPNPEQLQSLITWLQEKGIIIHTSIGEGNMHLEDRRRSHFRAGHRRGRQACAGAV